MNTSLNIARNFCHKLNWLFKDAGDFIVIGFDINNAVKPIYVKEKKVKNQNKSVLEISYFAGDVSEYENEKLDISSLLLKRNEDLVFGSWIIKTIVGDDVYEFRYHSNFSDEDINLFREIIGFCIAEINFLESLEKK